MRLLAPILVALGLFLGVAQQATACPMCQVGIAREAEAAKESGVQISTAAIANPALGYNISILFMMGMPFLIMGGFGTACYRVVRKAQRESHSEEFGDDTPGSRA